MGKGLFITNSLESRQLKDRIVDLIGNSKELRFLVGFFYFSGIDQLYEGLIASPDVRLDILVGLSVDRTIHGLVEYGEAGRLATDNELAEDYLRSVRSAVNNDSSDTREFAERIGYVLKLIIEGRLRIRKTVRPNHAKLYLFRVKDELQKLRKAFLITGSSNLTAAGLFRQEELNVELSDYGTEEAEEYFDTLWQEAVPITENDVFRERLVRFFQNESLVTEISPFEAFAFVLKQFLDAHKGLQEDESLRVFMERKGYKPYQYQLDAVAQALQVIKNPQMPNGAVVCDVVGLGKTVVACLVAHCLGKRGVVICPPGIVGDDNRTSGWRKYVEDFDLLGWEVRSCGLETLAQTLELVRGNDSYEVVIVDEVHRFRNQDTEAYELLSSICRNHTVILLSATPFNNSPADIFALLKLFVVPGRSQISLNNDLNWRFKEYTSTFKKLADIRKNAMAKNAKNRNKARAEYAALFGDGPIDLNRVRERAKVLAGTIRQVIEPVVIRRNRLDLKSDPVYSKDTYELSEVRDPIELFFELTPEQSDFYDKIIEQYFGGEDQQVFTGAMYRPFAYELGKEELLDAQEGMEKNRELLIQKNLYDFMRRLLVKRFESSFGAFAQSVRNFERISETVLRFIEKTDHRFVLDRKFMEKVEQGDPDDIEDALTEYQQRLDDTIVPKADKVYEIDAFKRKDEFLRDIAADKTLFGQLLEKLDDLRLLENDPKLSRLVEALEKDIPRLCRPGEPQRKVVIFTEYADTAVYLAHQLEQHFPGRVLTSAGPVTSSGTRDLLENFDASSKVQSNAFHILVGTDRVSEGFNLNRAGAVINYDIPWNPTRVIQRVGRINRIGKKLFAELFIFNFFPTIKGADYVRSRAIAEEKMFVIHNTLGEDCKIFEPDEEPSPSKLFERVTMNPDQMEGESFQTKVRRTYSNIQKDHPEVIARLSELPLRVKTAKTGDEYSLCVFVRKGSGFYVKVTTDGKQTDEPPLESVFMTISCPVDEPRRPFSSAFWECYERLKEPIQIVPRSSGSDFTLETKARNNLKTLLKSPEQLDRRLQELLPFIRALLEDIQDYKTLPDFTLRRIGTWQTVNPSPTEVKVIVGHVRTLQRQLGADYLQTVKAAGYSSGEVVIAIENVSEDGKQ